MFCKTFYFCLPMFVGEKVGSTVVVGLCEGVLEGDNVGHMEGKEFVG
jgi:hypothetical protein